jgi:DtxR family transcriptional regulator, Mn-dependent transcriptional regulator
MTEPNGGQVPPAILEALDAVHRLAVVERASPTSALVARRLGIPKSTAAERVLALQTIGLVHADLSGQLTLTAEGRHQALGLMRGHRLLERFLTDTLKLPWERVHEEAARLATVLAPDVADALDTFLHHPATCPHGNAIPSLDGGLPDDGDVPLSRLTAGQRGVITRIEREELELLRYLATLGLLPETTVEVEEVAPFGGPLLVRVGSSRYALGRKVAARVRVRVGASGASNPLDGYDG